MRVTWLADVLTGAGLTVAEVPGWQGRGRELPGVEAVVCHDTVTPPSWTVGQNVRLCRDGHSSLPGPLYQAGVDRDGRVHLIADGKANHNGYGRHGNHALGIAAFCNGAGDPEEPWNPAQRQTIATAAGAVCRHLNLPEVYILGHKETDPSRKQDPHRVDMDRIRHAAGQPAVPTPPEDDMLVNIDGGRTVYHVLGATLHPVPTPQHAEVIAGPGWRDKVRTVSEDTAAAYRIVHPDDLWAASELRKGAEAVGSSAQGVGEWSPLAVRHLRDQGVDLDQYREAGD